GDGERWGGDEGDLPAGHAAGGQRVDVGVQWRVLVPARRVVVDGGVGAGGHRGVLVPAGRPGPGGGQGGRRGDGDGERGGGQGGQDAGQAAEGAGGIHDGLLGAGGCGRPGLRGAGSTVCGGGGPAPHPR